MLALLASQETGTPVSGECRLTMERDGELTAVDMAVRATPFRLGQDTLTAFVLHDISASKRREVLEQVFLHDLRNTLAGIEGWSETLKQEKPSAAAEEILRLAEQLSDEVNFQKMVSMAEEGALAIEKRLARPSDILIDLLSTFRLHKAARGRGLDAPEPVDDTPINTDRVLLRRVLINMVANALEHTKPGGTVRVWFEHPDGRPRFVVWNDGVIDEEARSHVFERHFSTKPDAGRGLGAYSMKLFGERYLGGTVAFTSDSHEGTRFSVVLPADALVSVDGARAATPAVAGAEGEAPATEKPCVLLVDDDEALLKLGSLLLKRLGHDVVACHDGTEALDAFQGNPDNFSVVVTDLSMCPMSGVDLCGHLHEIRPAVPVLLCTGFTDALPQEQVRQLGMCGTLPKPYNVADLAEALGAAMAGRQQPSPPSGRGQAQT